MAVAQFLGVRQRLRYIMNVLRWQRLFHRRRDNRPSPLASIVGRVRFVRGSWERDMQSRSHAAQQRTSRVADARKKVVYRPPEYERESWPGPAEPGFPRLWIALVVAIAAVLLVVTGVLLSGTLPWWRGVAH